MLISISFSGKESSANEASKFLNDLKIKAQVGRKLYQQGILPDGRDIQAIVSGDIPVEGEKFSCSNCHGRSGMGSVEGQYVVPPITGEILFISSSSPLERSAYNEKSLARALRSGINPDGRIIDALMPRYPLSDESIKALSDYLKEMSIGQRVGIDKHTIRFATIISKEVPPAKKKAVIDVYNAYISKINAQTRLESKRPNRGNKPEIQLPSLYREWKLDIWQLKGDETDWPSQLENYYKKRPVFAIIGGISEGSWKPVGRFCEQQHLPCLFPSTILPEVREDDYYTMYFSRGVELEAELIAHDLNSNSIPGVVQVFCNAVGLAAANKLRLKLNHKMQQKTIQFDCEKSFPEDALIRILNKMPGAATVFWLKKEKINQLKEISLLNRLYVSSAFLKRQYSGLLASISKIAYSAHPYLLPGKFDSALARFKVWARISHVKTPYPKIQAEAFFTCFAVSDTLNHIRRYRLRDYFLEMLDHSQALALYLPFYPNASMGPGQRFLTKGGYLLPVVRGIPQVNKAKWLSL